MGTGNHAHFTAPNLPMLHALVKQHGGQSVNSSGKRNAAGMAFSLPKTKTAAFHQAAKAANLHAGQHYKFHSHSSSPNASYPEEAHFEEDQVTLETDEQFWEEGVEQFGEKDDVAKALGTHDRDSDPSEHTYSKGVHTFRSGFFYSGGKTSTHHAEKTSKALTDAGIRHSVLDHGTEDKPFKGGGDTKANSHHWVKVKVHKEEPKPTQVSSASAGSQHTESPAQPDWEALVAKGPLGTQHW